MTTFNDIRPGDAIPAHIITLSRERYFGYNAMIGEINPLHFDDDYAKKMGFKAPVVAGVFTYALAPRLIEAWAGKPGACRRIAIRFIGPAYIDDKIMVAGTVEKKYSNDGRDFAECKVFIEHENGTKILEAAITVEF